MKQSIYVFRERILNLVAIAALCTVLGTAFIIEFAFDQLPCTLCFLERIAIMGMSFSLYLNILFGVHIRHYSFVLVWALFGMSMAFMQVLLKVCEPKLPGQFLLFSYRLPSWSFSMFFLSILGVAALLLIPKEKPSVTLKKNKDNLVYIAAGLLVLSFGCAFFSVLVEVGW